MVSMITLVLIGLTTVYAQVSVDEQYLHSGSYKSSQQQTNNGLGSPTPKYHSVPQPSQYIGGVSPVQQPTPYAASPAGHSSSYVVSAAPQPSPYVPVSSAGQPSPYVVSSAPQPSPYPSPYVSVVSQPSPYVPVSGAPQPSPYIAGSSASQPSPYVAGSSAPQPSQYIAGSSASQPSPYIAGSSAPQPSPYLAISNGPQPTPYVPVSPAPQPNPYVAVSPKFISAPVAGVSAQPSVPVTPVAAAPKYATHAQIKSGVADKDAQIVSEGRDVGYDGTFDYGFNTENGISVQSKGYIKPAASPNDEPIQVIEGSYTYFDHNGKPQTIKYIADENGYRAYGDGIPQPHEAILKALAHRR